MFGLFGMSDSLVGEKLPENSKRAVETLFSRHYNDIASRSRIGATTGT